MDYTVSAEKRPNTMALDEAVFVLSHQPTGSSAEIWPALGFNCFRWQTRWQNQTLDLLYADAQLIAGARPTRSGIPILFPFPNRIRDGRFTWEGKTYQVPANDPTKVNAIHGFTPFRPWRVVGQGADIKSAWVTGEFQGSVDAADCREFWPADYRLDLTYRLTSQALRIEARVTNPDKVPLPFGLGFHPYTKLPFLAGTSPDTYGVRCGAAKIWSLDKNLPSGPAVPVSAAQDLRTERPVASLTLDDVYTGLEGQADTSGLCRRGQVRQTTSGVALELWTSPDFRDVVVFTPPHRHAICLEPYTCTTDAINLQQRGIDAGLRVLAPGAQWQGVVEFRVMDPLSSS
jgi:aldose 1-epimerase